MTFLYGIDIRSGTTNLPTPATFASMGIKHYYGAGGGCFNNAPSDWSLNTTFINNAVDSAIAGGYYGVVFDEEITSSYADPRYHYGGGWVYGQSDPLIDVVLDAFQAAYNHAKARQPTLSIGFYDFPNSTDGSDSYYYPLYYGNNPTGSGYSGGSAGGNAAWYSAYLDRIKRCNQRWNGSGYTSTPFVVDFLSRAAYAVYGNDPSHMSQWATSNRVSTTATRTCFPTLKNYPHISNMYHPSSSWRFIAFDGNAMQITLDTMKNYADGTILWQNWFASLVFQDWLFTPTGGTEAAILANWQTVTNGSFVLWASRVPFTITGVNTSAATSMADVASILQTTIQSQMAAVGNLPNPVSSVQFDDPYPVANVTVSWVWTTIKGFLFNAVGNGSNSSQPPHWNRTEFFFQPGGGGATDLTGNSFLGPAGVNTTASPGNLNWTYGGASRDSDEYGKWWLGSPHWNVFMSEAAGRGFIVEQDVGTSKYYTFGV